MVQEASKTAQEASKTAQEGPKNASRGAPGGEHETTFRAHGPTKPPGSPKRPLRGPKRPPRSPQEAPKRPPSGPRRPPKCPPEHASKRQRCYNMGRRNERSDPPPPGTVCETPPHDLQEFFPLSHLAHALLVPMPFLRALATPPRVLPGARSFRRPWAPGCTRGALWPPFPSQNDSPFKCYVSGRRRALSETSPGAHWAGFGGLLGPSWADLHRP